MIAESKRTWVLVIEWMVLHVSSDAVELDSDKSRRLNGESQMRS
jgi:hypothetical protein